MGCLARGVPATSKNSVSGGYFRGSLTKLSTFAFTEPQNKCKCPIHISSLVDSPPSTSWARTQRRSTNVFRAPWRLKPRFRNKPSPCPPGGSLTPLSFWVDLARATVGISKFLLLYQLPTSLTVRAHCWTVKQSTAKVVPQLRNIHRMEKPHQQWKEETTQ